MADFIEVRTLVDSEKEAQQIADALVSEHLAVRVLVSGPVQSTVLLKTNDEHNLGPVTTEEWICTALTRKDLFSAVEELIEETIDFLYPEILATEVLVGARTFPDWLQEKVQLVEVSD
jgi:periplasmic divalent cation tolerance protein